MFILLALSSFTPAAKAALCDCARYPSSIRAVAAYSIAALSTLQLRECARALLSCLKVAMFEPQLEKRAWLTTFEPGPFGKFARRICSRSNSTRNIPAKGSSSTLQISRGVTSTAYQPARSLQRVRKRTTLGMSPGKARRTLGSTFFAFVFVGVLNLCGVLEEKRQNLSLFVLFGWQICKFQKF